MRKFLITLSTLLLFTSKTANSVPDAGSLLKGEEDIKSYKKIPRTIPKIDKEKDKKSKSDFFLLFTKYFDTVNLNYKMINFDTQIFDKKVTFSEINFKKNLLFAN